MSSTTVGAVRQSILLFSRVQHHAIGRRPPLSLPIRWVANRYIPWAARSSFKAGIHRVNDVLMEIPRPPDWGGGGEFHMALGTYEHTELSYVIESLRPGDTFVDVGAHIGYFALPAAKKVGPTGAVLAIEPTPSSVAMLRRNIALNGFQSVKVIEAAASRSNGHALFAVDETVPMWNALIEQEEQSHSRAMRVQTVKLDTVLAGLGGRPVACIKIDAEGAETAVLEGARDVLERNPNVRVIFEVSGQDPRRRAQSIATLQFLEQRGFAFRRLGTPSIGPHVGLASLIATLQPGPWQQSLFNVVAEISWLRRS